MNVLKRLVSDERFWLAVVDVIQVVLFHYVTDFPEEIWQSVHTLLLVLIGAITAGDMVSLFRGMHWSQKE
jgi:hypothetical protein